MPAPAPWQWTPSGIHPGDDAVATEHLPAASLTFTASGAWWLKSPRGAGQVDPGWLFAVRPGEEYECRHPDGVTDRSLSVTFLHEVEPVSRPLVRVGERGRRLRRRLWRAATARHPDPEEIDSAAASLLAWARRPGEDARRIGAMTQARVAEVRRWADRGFTDAELDLVAAGKAAGLSRTRLIHAFREIAGVTPHRYLLERRVSHAARLLAVGGGGRGKLGGPGGTGPVIGPRQPAAARRALHRAGRGRRPGGRVGPGPV